MESSDIKIDPAQARLERVLGAIKALPADQGMAVCQVAEAILQTAEALGPVDGGLAIALAAATFAADQGKPQEDKPRLVLVDAAGRPQ